MKWKVFVFLLVFCALLLIILWLFQTVLLETFYRNIRVMEIRRNAADIANNIESDDINEILADISEDSNFAVVIIDLDGRIAFPTHDLPAWRGIAINTSFITSALDNGGVFYEHSVLSAPYFGRGNLRGNRPPIHSLIYVQIAENTTGKNSLSSCKRLFPL